MEELKGWRRFVVKLATKICRIYEAHTKTGNYFPRLTWEPKSDALGLRDGRRG